MEGVIYESPNNGSDGHQSSNSKWISNDEQNASGNGNTHGNPDLNVGDASRNNQGTFLVFCKYGLPIS
ncbi:hypothetical protein SLEP1_g46300 [Rubroshorea leprosula]|uniref:Uncharacterized protein n=1 Tax=Rubroshorea leprosula TaxID=152421 RepID=A0AAV5LMN9_9ROSI|nr:hypothetical protein SLEP1_g46300 [Rubroshorea leprosula]